MPEPNTELPEEMSASGDDSDTEGGEQSEDAEADPRVVATIVVNSRKKDYHIACTRQDSDDKKSLVVGADGVAWRAKCGRPAGDRSKAVDALTFMPWQNYKACPLCFPVDWEENGSDTCAHICSALDDAGEGRCTERCTMKCSSWHVKPDASENEVFAASHLCRKHSV